MAMTRALRNVLMVGLLSWVSVLHAQDHGVFSQFQRDFVFAPTFDHFMACADIGCETRQLTGISPNEQDRIRALFSSVSNAKDERKAIALALGLFELYVGRQDKIQTYGDLAKNTHLTNPVRSRQLDCFSESHNALTYMLILNGQKLLRFHRVDEIRRRGFLFDQHYAPLIIDCQTQEEIIVDTWFLPNAYPAVILPYSAWIDGNEAEYVTQAKNRRGS